MANFDDAHLLLDRAQKHLGELHDEARKIWQINSTVIGENRFQYRLTYLRANLPKLKPIVADVANNLRHSLDHVSAEAARMYLGEDKIDWRTREKIKFPFPMWDASLSLETDKLERYISPDVCAAIRDVWAGPATHPYYLHVVRVISGAAKHWELRLTEPNILAVQPFPNGEGSIQIPKDHFEKSDELVWEGQLCQGIEAIVTMQFGDIEYRPQNYPMPPDPDTVFSTTATYVREMIKAVESALA